jgi:cytoskeletal protein RodZ
MKPQVKDPLDKLFTPLSEAQPELPSAAFLQDVENRLDALQKKRRKPLAIWWVWSALGALLFIGILYSANLISAKSSKTAKATPSPKQAHSTTISKSSTSTTSPTLHISPSSSSSLPSSSFHTKLSFTHASITPPLSLTPTELAAISESFSISSTDPHFSAPIRSDKQVSQENHAEAIRNEQETSGLNAPKSDTTHLMNSPLDPAVPNITSQSMQTPSRRPVKHALGLQFGVSAIFSSFEVDSSVNALIPPFTYKELREWRELGERQTSSWDLSLRYQYNFGNWGLQTGLSYLEWGEQYTYKVISVEGTNRYQYVQVPLGLSYQIPVRKMILQPAIGLGLGYGVKRAGAYILPNNNGVAVVESKKWVANGYAQLELVYQVNSQMKFSVSPTFRYTLGKIVDNHVIMNRYQSLGLVTGFMYSF